MCSHIIDDCTVHSTLMSSDGVTSAIKTFTITCLSLRTETIEYNTSNNSNCYLTLLDASKAFDRLKYTGLFTILRQHNMCLLAIRS